VSLLDRLELVRTLDPPARAAIADAARTAGAPVHLVGGAVRDLLLERPTVDADLVVEGDGVAVARSLAQALGGRLVIHQPFATAEVHLPGHVLDVASARRERYAAPGALPTVELGAPLGDDLARRDFTVNAMALRLEPVGDGEPIDPLGGRADLAAGRLRVLHDRSFVDDPTRLVRGARYAARLGLALEPSTAALAREAARPETIWSVGGPRLREALALLAAEPEAAAAFALLDDLGVLGAIAPGAAAGPELAARMAALDAVRVAHAPGEGEPWRGRLGLALQGVPPDALEALLTRLEPSARDAAAVVAAARARPPLPARASELTEMLDRLPVEGVLAHGVDEPEPVARYLDALRHVRLAVDGDDLQAELGIPPSPAIGAMLATLRRRLLDGEMGGRDAQLAAARRMLGAMRP